MEKITGNEKAHPEIHTKCDTKFPNAYPDTYSSGGLTIRQHFAAMAAQGILSGADLSNQNGIYVNDGFIHPQTVAKTSVEIADYLIAELNKPI